MPQLSFTSKIATAAVIATGIAFSASAFADSRDNFNKSRTQTSAYTKAALPKSQRPTYSSAEIIEKGHGFFGSTTSGQLGDLNWKGELATGTKQFDYSNSNLEVFPVPVVDFATIRFNLDADSEVEISLYSLVGQKVAAISYGSYPSGIHSISWNGADDSGHQLGTGMYILKMTAGSEVSTLKILKK